MDQDTLTVLVVVAYFVGVAAAVIWPYINTRLTNPGLAFDWRYATWQAVGGVLVFVTSALAVNSLPNFAEYISQGWVGIILALIAGYGAARGGRELQRTNEARIARKNGD